MTKDLFYQKQLCCSNPNCFLTYLCTFSYRLKLNMFYWRRGHCNYNLSKTIIAMGPAVFNGGFSTFLAFSILMVSKSFVFKVFFKIFFLVVVFGLYHGLVFLPVVLSFLGPPPASSQLGSNTVRPDEGGVDKKENRNFNVLSCSRLSFSITVIPLFTWSPAVGSESAILPSSPWILLTHCTQTLNR